MRKYPTHKLSDPRVRNAKPKDKLYRLRDGGGLFCEVLTTGSKVWRYNYRLHGKQKTFTIANTLIPAYQMPVPAKMKRKIWYRPPMVMVRPSELNNAEWSEFDLDSAMWTIPAKRRKLPTHIKRANNPEDAHQVPLSSQAIAVLKEIHQYTGRGNFVFPSARGRSRAMSNNAIRVALTTMGFDNDTITAHGFRGVASTFLNLEGATKASGRNGCLHISEIEKLTSN